CRTEYRRAPRGGSMRETWALASPRAAMSSDDHRCRAIHASAHDPRRASWPPPRSMRMAPLEARDPSLHELIAPDAPIERIAGGLWFTEGPVWRAGELLFSDIPNKRIVRWRRLPEGPELTTYARGSSNGLTLDREGRVVAAEHDGRRVSRVADDGTRPVL